MLFGGVGGSCGDVKREILRGLKLGDEGFVPYVTAEYRPTRQRGYAQLAPNACLLRAAYMLPRNGGHLRGFQVLEVRQY